MIRSRFRFICAVALLSLGGCGRADAANDSPAAGEAAVTEERTPVHVDSVRPIDEEIRRFREQVGRRVDRLERGRSSHDALVADFIRAIESADTVALAGMAINAAEFIDLYYPHTQYTAKPYELSPGILWLLVSQNSEKGFTRILRRFGGQALGYRAYSCGEARMEGPNRLWDDCTLERAGEAGPETSRLFGSIMERDGRFAFVSYANDL